MRIAPWNLERGGRTRSAREAQDATLRELAADVVVLTEPPALFTSAPGVVTSPARRQGPNGLEPWIAIVGGCVEAGPVATLYEHLGVAARVATAGRNLVVYGGVLPWLAIRSHAPELVLEGETFADVFDRILSAQNDDLLSLRAAGTLIVWAGDFNQSLRGPNWGGSTTGREALSRCLTELGMVAWNAGAQHARDGMCAIDLICGPADLVVLAQGRIDPVREGVRMSDHAGYWVDLELG
jgi:endonuclease/exonuclease/phosphatase family metal-dependent hydrolase